MVNKKRLAIDGPELSELILGLWRLPDVKIKEIEHIVKTAIEQGITTIDQADIYGNYKSQVYLGRLLKEQPSLLKDIQIVSKAGIHLSVSKFSKSGIGYYNTSKEHLIESVNTTLKDLCVDRIDLLLIHRPDPLMNPYELDETFKELKKAGKVKHFGVSNFTPIQFEMLKCNMDTPLVTNQVEFSVLETTALFDGTFDNCIKNRISPMIWSPLAGGKIFTGNSDQEIRTKKELQNVAEELNASVDQVALAWIKMHPSKPHIIIGTMQAERIISAANSTKLQLSREQWFRILVASQGHRVP